MTEGALSGLLIDGRYRVGPVIGRGGFGVVYEALHVGLDARVALKVPRVDRAMPREAAEMISAFLDEGRTLKRLRHPSLVAVTDVGTLPPDAAGLAIPYLVLEWCDGPTLKEWLEKRRAPMPVSEAWALLRSVVEALAHAHEEGVVHRDLKPANILLETSRSGALVPRVIDFGIAKVVELDEAAGTGATQTTSENRSFTPRYAAPEQLMGLRTGPWTDVWALALVLLEAVQGRPVFATTEEVRRRILEADLPTPAKLGLDVSPWEAVLTRALAPRAPDRHRDARELLTAMDAVGRGGEVAMPRVAAGEAAPSNHGDVDGAAHPSREGPWRAASPPRSEASSAPRAGLVSSARAPSPARSGAPRGGPDDTLDATGVPSSHVLRTEDATARLAPRRRRSPLPWVAGATLLLGVGAAAALAGGRWLPRAAPTADVSAAVPERRAPASEPTPDRAISSLTAEEVDARARAAGMTGCTSMSSSGQRMVTCGGGYIHLMEQPLHSPRAAELVRTNMQFQAAMVGSSYGAARFTTGDGWSLLVTGPAATIDGVTSRVLEGTRHDAVGTEVIPPLDGTTPARLDDWTSKDLLRQLLAVGGTPLNLVETGGATMLTFTVGKDAGQLTLVDGDIDAYLRTSKGGLPYAYGIEGSRLLGAYCKDPRSDETFLRKILGPTPVSRVGRSR